MQRAATPWSAIERFGSHALHQRRNMAAADRSTDATEKVHFRLFAEFRRRGLEPERSMLREQTVGTHIRLDGGNTDLQNNRIRKGMPIQAKEIVIPVSKL